MPIQEYHAIYDDQTTEWKVKKNKNERATEVANTKEVAIQKAATLAQAHSPAEVYIHYKAPGEVLKFTTASKNRRRRQEIRLRSIRPELGII